MKKNGGLTVDLTVRDHIAIEVVKALVVKFTLDEIRSCGPDASFIQAGYTVADAMIIAREL